MANDISFTFNEAELKTMAGTAGIARVVFTLRNFRRQDPPELSSFVFAQAYNAANQPIDKDNIIVGCPVPPGWQDDEPQPPGVIKDADLQQCPKFSADAATLRELLQKNKLLNPAGEHRVLLSMEGRLVNPQQIELIHSVKCLNETGSVPLGAPVDATIFA